MQTFTEKGYSVGVVKPIETGVVETAEDGSLLLQKLKTLNPKAWAMDLDDVVPVRMRLPASPLVAKGDGAIDWSAIDRAVEAMDAICDICLIEGAGGLLVPVDEQTDMIDLVTRFHAKALLVSHCRLGCINDLRLSLEVLQQRGIPHEWVLNCREEQADFTDTSRPYFDACHPGWYALREDTERLCDALLL